ncbi:MAG: hypothetical protein PF961_07835 [Planctomycetota bacterium]|jgi:beta-mannosidase|nr:hypothetical protein [Planctomycetota bacterium]
MQYFDLGGTWQWQDAQGEHQVPATVPGSVHQDLLEAGVIADLNWRDNERHALWVAEREWTVSRSFDLDAAAVAHEYLVLDCEGLDTLATVSINDQVVLRADNMFRRWEADVKAALRPGSNTISVTFASPLPMMAERQAEFALPAWNVYNQAYAGKSYVRKMACSFGWDWGLMAATVGIWRGIGLGAWSTARLDDVRIHQDHSAGVSLTVDAAVSGAGTATVTISYQGNEVARGSAGVPIAIPDPQLWWPNGMGAQALYQVCVVLTGADGAELDRQERRIGLRTMRINREQDQWGESFGIAVNGVRVFSKGSNWIPADVLVSRLQPSDYQRLLGAAADCNHNCVRLWGGGTYEQDAFYEVCDERGLLIWHDFMFACATYPSFDRDWLSNVKHEVEDNLQRLRHHASIALWCGNNELEQGLVSEEGWNQAAMSWKDYCKLFDDLLPELVAAHDGERDYWPCSPHSPSGNRRHHSNPNCGDAHCWTVWFGGQPFEAQRDWTHRFMSEFGFQSFPELKTIETFTAPEDRNLCSRVMDYHQRSKNKGNKTIYAYLLDWFQVPKDFEETLWGTQLTQALCIQYAAEHSRHLQPRMEGCVYWQLNDLWPAATWSSIDSCGRWKALQYFSKRFFEPILVGGVEHCGKGTVTTFVSNHRATAIDATVRWTATDCAGAELARGDFSATIPSQGSVDVGVIDAMDLRLRKGAGDVGAYELRQVGADGVLGQYEGECDLMIWLRCEVDGAVVSRNLTLFARPKHLELQDPGLSVEVEAVGGGYEAVVRAERPALWTRLGLNEADATFADNFFHLQAGETRRITIMPTETLDEDALRAQLRVSSLYHSYSHGADAVAATQVVEA